MRRGLRKQMQMGLEWAIRRSDESDRSDTRRKLAVLLHLPSCFERRLRRCQSRHRHAERRATDIAQPDAMAELDALRVAAVLAADAQLDVRPSGLTLFDSDSHKLANACLIDRSKRILQTGVGQLMRIAVEK